MNCERCEVESEELSVGECPLCQKVTLVLAVIYTKWKPEEYEDLARNLRDDTVAKLIEHYEGCGAFLSARVCRLMRHLGHSLPQGADYLKTRVIAELIRQHAHEESCRKYLAKNNMTFEDGRRALGTKIYQTWRGAFSAL